MPFGNMDIKNKGENMNLLDAIGKELNELIKLRDRMTVQIKHLEDTIKMRKNMNLLDAIGKELKEFIKLRDRMTVQIKHLEDTIKKIKKELKKGGLL